jgi:hypothetical protein
MRPAGLVLGVLMASTGALAADAPDWETIIPRKEICFRRVFDARHLQGHPRQTVREMTLLYRPGEEEAVNAESDEREAGRYVRWVGLSARFVGSDRIYATGGLCRKTDDGGVTCSDGACDNSWGFRLRSGGPGVLLLRSGLEDTYPNGDARYIEMTAPPCTPGDGGTWRTIPAVSGRFTDRQPSDDRDFRLEQVPVAECRHARPRRG